MATRYDEKLGTYTQWAEAFSREGLERALRDQANIRHGQLNNGNEHTRYTPAQGDRRTCDTVRAGRDDLEFRDWNSEHGFSGASRPMNGPGSVGMAGTESEGQHRRRRRREVIDEGF
jgi:hypothetical protein